MDEKIPEIIPERVFNNSEELLTNDRFIFIEGTITDITANSIITQLLDYWGQCPEPITMVFANTTGNDPRAALAVYDVMRLVQAKCKIATVAIGEVNGLSAVLFAAGSLNNRYMAQHSRLVMQQMAADIKGDYDKVSTNYKALSHYIEEVERILFTITKNNKLMVRVKRDHDFYLTPIQACDNRLADNILLL